MNYNMEATSLTFGRGSEVSQVWLESRSVSRRGCFRPSSTLVAAPRLKGFKFLGLEVSVLCL